jgi:hypothetical protein
MDARPLVRNMRVGLGNMYTPSSADVTSDYWGRSEPVHPRAEPFLLWRERRFESSPLQLAASSAQVQRLGSWSRPERDKRYSCLIILIIKTAF